MFNNMEANARSKELREFKVVASGAGTGQRVGWGTEIGGRMSFC